MPKNRMYVFAKSKMESLENKYTVCKKVLHMYAVWPYEAYVVTLWPSGHGLPPS